MTDNRADLNQLILMLGEGGIRETIPSKLHKFDESAIKPLLDALQNPDEELRLGAVWAIGQVNNSLLGASLGPLAIEPLVNLLQSDPSARVRLQALKTLALIAGSTHRDMLNTAFITALADSSDVIRAEAARWLGQYRSEPALDALRDLLLNDSSDKARSRAAYALAYIEPALGTLAATGTVGIEALLTALSDSERSVRLRAIWALGKLKSAGAIRSLANILESDSPNYHEKQMAAEALGNIGDPSTVEPLVSALQFDRHEGVRCAAAEALGKLGDLRSLHFLIHTLHNDVVPAVRASAAKALEDLGTSNASDALLIALNDSSPDVLFRVVQALQVVGDSRAIEPLNQLIADEKSGKLLRQAAERAVEALNR